jgi:hypothetical protein
MKSCLNCKKLKHEIENDNTCILCKISSGEYVDDFSPKAFHRAYVKALFLEKENWITAIEKYQMIVAGSPKSTRDRAKNTAEIESLAYRSKLVLKPMKTGRLFIQPGEMPHAALMIVIKAVINAQMLGLNLNLPPPTD